jgi:hypothetical protein
MIRRHGKKWRCEIDHKVFDDPVEARNHAAALAQEQRKNGSLPWCSVAARRKIYLRERRKK